MYFIQKTPNFIKPQNQIFQGSDKRKFPKLLIEESHHEDDTDYFEKTHNQCVEKCPIGYEELEDICFKAGSLEAAQKFDEDIGQVVGALKATWYYIIVICFVAFIFSYVFLILFRHAAKYVIWIINIGFVVLVVGLAILCAVAGVIEGAVIFGIMGLVLIGFLIFFRKRIALVAKLFKEASKALTDVPAIMFEPILVRIAEFYEKTKLILKTSLNYF